MPLAPSAPWAPVAPGALWAPLAPLTSWAEPLISGIGDHLLDDSGEFGRAERQAADPVIGDDVDQEPAAQHERELAEVDLGDQHLVVAAEHLAEVGRERRQVAEVGLGDRAAGPPDPAQ